MSDLISRADAIDAITTDGTRMERLGLTRITIVEAKQKAVDLLESLPSAEAEDRLYIKIYADDEPSVKAEKLYQICDETQNREVAEWLKEYFPSAEPVQGWISVGERLPENSGRYIVTLNDSWAITVKVAVYGVMPQDTHNKKVFWIYDSCHDDLDITEDVVAWRPLPDPYKGGEEE